MLVLIKATDIPKKTLSGGTQQSTINIRSEAMGVGFSVNYVPKYLVNGLRLEERFQDDEQVDLSVLERLAVDIIPVTNSYHSGCLDTPLIIVIRLPLLKRFLELRLP